MEQELLPVAVLQALPSKHPQRCQVHIIFRHGQVTHSTKGVLSRREEHAVQAAVELIQSGWQSNVGRAAIILEDEGFEVTIVS